MAEPIASYVVTPHALLGMERRRIEKAVVEAVLAAPEQRLAVREGRDVLQSRIEVGPRTYLFRVFVDIDREPAEVVTVYRTSKLEKYWRSDP
jgi:hypothetical protein